MRIIAVLTAMVFVLLQFMAVGTMNAAAGEKVDGAGPVSALVANNNEFAVDMYKQIRSGEEGKNIFFSPLSISTAIGMTYAGARGNTENQMAEVMHFTLGQDELHPAFAALASRFGEAEGKGYQLKMANALWGQKDYHFEAAFLSIVKKYYEGGFDIVDFAGDTEGSRKTINGWVEKNTDDKIKDLLKPDDLTALTRLVLTNAIYFKGDWAAKFKKDNTVQAPFFIKPEETAEVEMMQQTDRFGYAVAEGLQILEMPYAGGDLSMVVLLPENGIDELDAKLSPAQLNSWLGSLREREVKVSLPKFKFEARYGLGNMLSAMGMPDAFDLPPADFSGMTGGKHLYITKVIHQAVIEVNEEGSEAAASTAVIMGVKSAPAKTAEFTADRPFIFLIKHKATGSILFLGRVVNPAAK